MDYANLVNKEFRLDKFDEDILSSVVVCCQDLFVGELKLDSSIARNDALKENVWMMDWEDVEIEKVAKILDAIL